MRDQLDAYVQDMGPLLAICGSYQMLGREWLVDGEKVPGLGLVGMTTGRPGTSGDRLVSNIALRSPLADEPVVGYENHAGRTYLDEGVEPFGTVVSNTGLGNNEGDQAGRCALQERAGNVPARPAADEEPADRGLAAGSRA